MLGKRQHIASAERQDRRQADGGSEGACRFIVGIHHRVAQVQACHGLSQRGTQSEREIVESHGKLSVL